MTESDLSQVFNEYGTISKVELISDNSARVEFINKTSIDTIMNDKNKIFFKRNRLHIEKARKAIPEKILLKKKKTVKKKKAKKKKKKKWKKKKNKKKKKMKNL